MSRGAEAPVTSSRVRGQVGSRRAQVLLTMQVDEANTALHHQGHGLA